MLNVECGCEKYAVVNGAVQEVKNPKPNIISAGRLKFRVKSNCGIIYCLLKEDSLEDFRIKLITALDNQPSDHLSDTLMDASVNVVVTSPSRIKRDIILAESPSPDAAFIWTVSLINESLFSTNLYYSMSHVIKCYSSILFDEDDLFTYKTSFVEKVSASKMSIPKLPDPLATASQSMDASQVAILVDQESYRIEFASRHSIRLCLHLENYNLHPHTTVKWKKARTNMVFETACERDCYVCRFPVLDFGLVVKKASVIHDEISENLIDIFCQYVEPILTHFIDNSKTVLVCKHCMRIIVNSIDDLVIKYDLVYFDVNSYKKVCEASHKFNAFAFLLDSPVIGTESRAIKVNNQFYIADKKEFRNVLIKDANIRADRLPFMHVSLYFYNSISGYY